MATWSVATRRSRRSPACTPPRDTRRTAQATRSPTCASAGRGRAGTPPLRRATAAPGPASGGTRTRVVLEVLRASPRCNTRRRMPTAAILTIGNELTSGDVANTNATWLAKRLERVGITVAIAASLPDEIDAVARFLRREAADVDFVLVTGGLGGTPDDLTREAVAAAFGVGQEVVPELAAALRGRFAHDPDYAARSAALRAS